MSVKMLLATLAPVAGALGLSIAVGAARRKPGGPAATPDEQLLQQAAKLEQTILEQHLLRIAMSKTALPVADMDRAAVAAQKLMLPKTAATLVSIKRDGKPGGPSYIPLPLDEKWPGTGKSVRQYITDAMAALAARATA